MVRPLTASGPGSDTTMTPPVYAVFGDSAFLNETRTTNRKLVRARKTNETFEIPSSAVLAAGDVIMQHAITSERQSAKWGVRALKGPFERLKTPLLRDSYKRYRPIYIYVGICCNLFTFRTKIFCFNQIQTTYERRHLPSVVLPDLCREPSLKDV